MQLDKLKLTGFKTIRQLELDLNSLNILIGANGAGKSNLITLFRLLNQMVEGNFQLFVRQQGGADAWLHFGRKQTEQIHIELRFGKNEYHVTWVPTLDDRLIFADETTVFHGDRNPDYEAFLGMGNLESQLLRAGENRSVPSYVLKALKQWKVYHFHDTSESAPVKRIGDINDNAYLRGDAGNLAAFLYRLQQHYPHSYQAIQETVGMVAPFFANFVLRPLPENENKIRLEWREHYSDQPFLAHYLSDGTLRFICLATLLLQPNPFLPSTILIDEPELGLHPYAINLLASLIQSVSTKTQVIIATQSVGLINQFQPNDLLVVERLNGATSITRPTADQLAIWLEDYTLGALWEMNILGGQPTR